MSEEEDQRKSIVELLKDGGAIEAEDLIHEGKRCIIRSKNGDDQPSSIPQPTVEGLKKDHQTDNNAEEHLSGPEQEEAQGTKKTSEIVLGEEIGSGGFGKVYKVKYIDASSKYEHEGCLKEALTAVMRNSVKEEINIFKKLSSDGHKHIIKRLFSCKRIGFEDYYLGLNFFRGHTVANIIAAYQAYQTCQTYQIFIDQRDVVLIFRQQADAVTHLWNNGIAHCDITPSNIMYDSETKTSMLIDFGLAVNFDDPEHSLECKGGTTEYMAPEMLLDDIIHVTSDAYGLAASIYPLIKLRFPWDSIPEIKQLQDKYGQSINTEDYRQAAKECIKAKMEQHRLDVTTAAQNHVDKPEMTVQTELLECREFYSERMIQTLREMLSENADGRPTYPAILDSIPDENLPNNGENDPRFVPIADVINSGKATENFQACSEGEITLQIGDVVTNIQELANWAGYSKGQVGDREGMFPSTFVKKLLPDE